MTEQDYDYSKIKRIEQTDNKSQANALLNDGWILLKVTETQFHDTYGALKADVVFTLGKP